jgi:hypothetical protein
MEGRSFARDRGCPRLAAAHVATPDHYSSHQPPEIWSPALPKPVKYLSKLWDDEALLTNWPPDKLLTPGDIIARDDNGVVSIESTISEVANRARQPLPSTELVSWEASPIQTQVGVSMTVDANATLKAGASAPAGSQASMNLRFDREGSFALAAEGGTITGYRSLDPWRRLLSTLQGLARWEPGWQLVTLVRDYERITLVRAGSAGQHATVQAAVPSVGTGGLVDIAAGAGLLSTSTACSTWTVTKGATLGYEGLWVKRRWVRSDKVETASLYHSYETGTLKQQEVVGTVQPDWDRAAEG